MIGAAKQRDKSARIKMRLFLFLTTGTIIVANTVPHLYCKMDCCIIVMEQVFQGHAALPALAF